MYKNIDTRVEMERSKSGNVQRVCTFCGKPFADHERERTYDGGPTGTYHYRYRCDDGFVPTLEREVQ